MISFFNLYHNYFVARQKVKAQSEVDKLKEIVKDLKMPTDSNQGGELSLEAQTILKAVEPDLKDAEEALARGEHSKAIEHAHHGIVVYENIY